MKLLGLIPAGGKSERWGGLHKMLLPCDEGMTFLDRTLRGMREAGAKTIQVVTNPENNETISNHLIYQNDVFCGLTADENDVIGAVKAAWKADRTIFGMPDTYYPLGVFEASMNEPLWIGTFKTKEPWRFGVIRDNRILDKQNLIGNPHEAWGVLSWTREVADFWREEKPATLAEALNMALSVFPFEKRLMSYYYDIENFDAYREFLARD